MIATLPPGKKGKLPPALSPSPARCYDERPSQGFREEGMQSWRNLTGKEVVVHAGGTVYEGTLVEMTDTSLILKAVTGFREVLMERVTRVEERGASSNGIRSPSPLDFSR